MPTTDPIGLVVDWPELGGEISARLFGRGFGPLAFMLDGRVTEMNVAGGVCESNPCE